MESEGHGKVSKNFTFGIVTVTKEYLMNLLENLVTKLRIVLVM
jgi:hypothetical protein